MMGFDYIKFLGQVLAGCLIAFAVLTIIALL